MSSDYRRPEITIAPELERLAYRCYPNGCPAGRTCCVGAAAEVSRREMRAIDSLMPQLATLQPSLIDAGGYVDVFVEDGGEFTIEHSDESGRCPLLFRRDGRELCSIHTALVTLQRPIVSAKPRSCRLWPLVVETFVETSAETSMETPAEMSVEASLDTPVEKCGEHEHTGAWRIGVHPSALALGCVAPVADLPQQPTLAAAFADEIEELRGSLS